MKQVKTIEKIMWLAERRKSIYHAPMKKKLPAAFIQNMQGFRLYQLVKGKSLWYD